MFHFRLQPVLDFRKQVENKLLTELAEIQNRLDHEETVLKKLREKKLDLISRLKKKGKGTLRSADLSVYVSYIGHLKKEEEHRERTLGTIAGELEEKRTELTEAMKKRKILEIVRDHKFNDHMVNQAEKERKYLDEVGIIRFGKGAIS